MLQPTVVGIYKFACSSDDHGRLYIGTDSTPASKVLIGIEPEWNGPRNYERLDRRVTHVNQSSGRILTGLEKYYLEYVFAEGGGGNNGSATWDADPVTGLPVANAFANNQSPLQEQHFALSRFAYGQTFFNLGPVVVSSGPNDTSVAEGASAKFSVILDGVPPWTVQWYKGALPIPGATGLSYNTPIQCLVSRNFIFFVFAFPESSSAQANVPIT